MVRVVDWGDKPPFIAFEYVEGAVLSEVLRRRKAAGDSWSEEELLRLFSDLISGLDAINREVIHRDIKPENVFLGPPLRVADFGIAKFVGEATRTRTLKGWGTANYMAPEVFRSESVDWRADQYSLGAVFYEIATLDPMFVGSWEALEQKHLFERPRLLSQVRADLSPRLANAVARMLSKRRDDRFASWEDLRAVLDSPDASAVPRDKDDRPSQLAGAALEQLELVRRKRDEARKIQEEDEAKRRERKSLLRYWAEELGTIAEREIAALCASLGEPAMHWKAVATPPADPENFTGTVEFINSAMRLEMEWISPDKSDEFVAWGRLEVTTPKRLGVINLLLSREPPPYGSWLGIELKVSVMMKSGFHPGQNRQGRYEVRGADRVVAALDAEAILHERERQNVMSGVNYAEGPLEFESAFAEYLNVFVEDAAADKPDSGGRGTEWRAFGR